MRRLLPPVARRLIMLALVLTSGVALVRPVHAGLFDDDEARQQIRDLAIKTNERLDTIAKGQIDLANQIQALREENARLRGQVETLTYELEAARKRQQDFYVDLDGRLRRLEPKSTPAAEVKAADESAAPAETLRKTAGDPAAETREYEAALNLFRAGKVKEAASALESFVRSRPDSSLTPGAYYWLGNAYYSLRDCRKAIDAQRQVVGKWPGHAKAPDALLNVATCQQELGDLKGAKTSLETLVAKYPDTQAASTARQRLKK